MRRNKQQSGERVVIFDHHGKPIPFQKFQKRAAAAGFSFGSGFKGANDGNLMDWALLPTQINEILRNDLARLRARSRDLARNDDTARRFLHLVKQNVLGHMGIGLQSKCKMRTGELNKPLNTDIEAAWKSFSRKRRRGGAFESPSACGTMSMREIAWLSLWSRCIDGECFIHILRGFPHNRNRFAVRFLNPDLLDSGYCENSTPTNKIKAGNYIDMGIEFDVFNRPVAYHFTSEDEKKERIRIPASQIIHIFRNEYVGQIRGIPDFAGIMHKAKMLNGVHEAIVVGWRVAAAKMGFFIPNEPDEEFSTGRYTGTESTGDDNEDDRRDRDIVIEAEPGSFEVLKDGYDFKVFDPDYPTGTYEMGNKVFMQQLSNGLNVSAPTLSNDYSGVNYSSLRQALLEDREAWRCIQAELTDGFYQPLFDEWYDWTTGVMRVIPGAVPEPEIEWRPRGWPWVDPLKEVNAQIAAINAGLRTRQSVISETTGMDFADVIDELAEEEKMIIERGLLLPGAFAPMQNDKDNDNE